MKLDSKPVVLLVEDHDEFRALAVLALESYLAGGVHLLAAEGVTEALGILRERSVDLVVSDVLLGDGGARVLLDGAAAWLGAGGKVILLSNHAPEALGGLLEHRGVVAYVSKTQGLSALADVVRVWLQL